KRKAQIVSIEGNNAQVMDLETYQVSTLPIPEELQGKLKAGEEVELLEAMGRQALSRIINQ
ncbi:translation initiation factor eIF-5A, partial [mine drainage metagenome]